MPTDIEKKHLAKCKADHFSTKLFARAKRKLLVCHKSGQYVDLDALREEIDLVWRK